MSETIQRVAIIGAGWMGGSIAALLASVGIEVDLLDVLPPMEPSRDELEKDYSGDARRWRDSRALRAVEQARRRGAFLDPRAVDRIRCGNMSDDLDRLGKADWILEAVPEVLDVKRAAYERIDTCAGPDSIVSSNTSGLLVRQLTQERPPEFRKRFLVSHFFNPVRQTQLLELVPGEDTDPAVVERLGRFAEERLGKGIIVSRDTPNFLANRLGLFAISSGMKHAEAMGVPVVEADRLTGPLLCRPKTATFRTVDIVGLDAMLLVLDSLHGSLAGDPFRETFNAPAFFRRMVAKGHWGEKSCGGFYMLCRQENTEEIQSIGLDTLQYGFVSPRRFASVAAAEKLEDPIPRIRELISGSDEGARYAWAVLSDILRYSAYLLGRIADDPCAFDRALRWGYNWERGPFEIWSGLGVRFVMERMQADGADLPESAVKLLESGKDSWFHTEGGLRKQFLPGKNAFVPAPPLTGSRALDALGPERRLLENRTGELLELDDGLACFRYRAPGRAGLELHRRAAEDIARALDLAEGRNFRGLILFPDGRHVSAGLDWSRILQSIDEGKWAELEAEIRTRQTLFSRLKQSPFPVLAVADGNTRAEGCEMIWACRAVQAHHDALVGLDAIQAGLVPAAGGSAELLRRTAAVHADKSPEFIVKKTFQILFQATVERGAFPARRRGFLRANDGISLGADRLPVEARRMLLNRISEPKPENPPFVLPGKGFAEKLSEDLAAMRKLGDATAHDETVGRALARILCGEGSGGPLLDERMAEREREAWLSLAGTEATRERIRHLARGRRLLRN